MKRKPIHSDTKMKRKRLAAASNRGAKALAGSISSFCRVLAVSAITAMGLGQAGAVTLTWDGAITNGTSLGGGGTWDAGTTANWWNGLSDQLWNNTGATDALFTNFGGNIFVQGPVSARSMTFSVAGYVLAGSGSIDFGAQNGIITVTNKGESATISAFLNGTNGFTKAGAGDLILESNNTGTAGIQGGITISGGTLILSYGASNPLVILKTSNNLTFTNTSEFQFQADTPGSPGASMALSTLTFSAGEGTVHSFAQTPLANAVMTFGNLAARVAGATGNFVQESLPQVFGVTAGGPGTTITLSTINAGKITPGDSVNGTNIGANTTVSGIVDNLNGTSTVTLSTAMTGSPSTQNITFGLKDKRIIFTAAPVVNNFINQGLFFNGNRYAWYDTADFARVRAINYGVDASTATQGTSTTGILVASGQHVQVTGDITGQGNFTLKTLNLEGSSFSRGILQSPGTTLTLTNAGILKSGGGSVTISGGTITASPLTTEFVLRADQSSDRLVINSVLAGTGGVTKSGQGSVLLNAQTAGALSLSGTATTSASTLLQLPFTAPQGLVDYVNYLAANSLPPLPVNGPGIPANTSISSISGSTVTLSQAATANAPLVQSYTTALNTASAVIQLAPAEAATLTVGQIVSGVGIAPNTTIAIGGINVATGAVTLSTAPIQSATSQTVSFGGATVAFGSTQNFSLQAGPQNSDHGLTGINSSTLMLLSAVPGLLPGVSVEAKDAGGNAVFPTGTRVLSVSPDGLTVTVTQVATSASDANFGAVTTYAAQVGGGARTTAVLPAGKGATVVPGTLVTGVNIPPGTKVTLVNVDTVTLFPAIPAAQTYQPAAAIPASSSTISLNASTQTPTLYVNELVSGPGIPAGTTIIAINNTTGVVTLSNPTTAPITTATNLAFGALGNQALTFGGATIAFGAGTLVLSPAQAATLIVGSTVTGTNIPAGTTVTAIQDFGTYKVATLSTSAIGTASAQFLSFGGATVVGINSAYGGGTQVNSGIFAVSAAGLPALGAVGIAGGAEFAALNSVITNAITLSGGGAALSGAGGSNSGFSGAISAGANDFQLIARDFRDSTAANLLVSSSITGTGRLTVPQSSTGIVTLTGNNSAFTGPVTIENTATLSVARLNSLTNNAIDLTGTLKLALDGDSGAAYAGGNGTGAQQTLLLNNSINISGAGTIQPDRDGTGYGGYFTTAGNKTIQLNTLAMDAETLTIQNNAGSGVMFNGTATMNGAGTFTVVNATASSAVPGLTLSGKLSGGGSTLGSATFVKSGAGTLVLANNLPFLSGGNTFGGGGSFIDVQGGVLSVATDAALGDAANSVQLSNATLAALRATGNIITSRQVVLNTATGSTLEVTAGNTLTLNSQLILPTGLETNALVKGDNGTLVLGGNNSATLVGTPTAFGTDPWKGLLTINAGAVRISNGNALGTTDAGVIVARTGAALQVSGAASVADRLTLTGTGIGSAGAVQGVTGTSTLTGQIVLATSATIGADTGATVNVAGGISGTSGANLTLNTAGTGVINITTNSLDPAYSVTGDTGSTNVITNVSDTSNLIIGQRIKGPNIPNNATITGKTATTITLSANATGTTSGSTFIAQGVLNVVKFGTGTAALQVSSPGFGGSITVNQGTFSIAGSGAAVGPAAGANVINLQGPSGILTLNDVAGPLQRIAVIGTYSATVGNGATAITLTPGEAATLSLGQTVTGIGIAPNTTVSAIRTNTSGAITGVIDLSTGTTGTTSATQALTFASRNLVMAGGTFAYTGNSAGSVQNLGWLTALRGATNVISTTQTGAGTVTINFGGLASTTAIGAGNSIGGDASIDFQGATLGTTGANKIAFAVAPGLTNGVIQRATINGTDFVTYNAVGGYTLITTKDTATIPAVSTTGLVVGQTVTGTGIPTGVTIASINPNVSITLSNGSGVVAGTNFLTFGSNANGIQALAAYNSSNNIDAAGAGDTMNLTVDPATVGFTQPRTINAFKISSATSLTVADNGLRANSLTLTSGAILSTTGTNTLNFKVIAFGVTQAFVAVNAVGTLNVNSLLTGTGGFVKGLGGILQLNPPTNSAGYGNLSAQTLTGNFSVNGGTVKLSALLNNTLTPNQFLILAPGTSLDLNGRFQFAQGTRGDGAALQGNAGTFTNTSVTPAALIFGQDTGATSFGGVITQQAGQGATSFFKGGPGTYGFLNANPYTGATIFAGGTNTLLDGGTLSATTSIGVNYARLTLDDNQIFALANRVNAGAPITLKGGSLVYQGRVQTATSQTVGGVVLSEGQNLIQAINGGTGVNSAVLTLASLTRPGGSAATVRFPDNGTLGLIGNSANVIITSAPSLAQNLIGPWAVVDREYASYVATRGVGALNASGFAGYSTNALNRQPLATDNIRTTLSLAGLTVDTTVNTFAVNTNVAAVNGVPVPTIIDLGTKKLTLAGGGLLLALGGDNQNITVRNGTITSGAVNVGGDLYLQALNYGGNNRTFTISAGITDNGTGAVRLIKSSGQGDTAVGGTTADFTLLSGVNTYTGGTVINGGNLVVGAGGNIPAGGLTISGGEVTGVANVFQDPGGVIAAANTVTVNGLGALTLTGTNTLAGLVFNNAGGGTTAPTVTTFRSTSPIGTGTLTLTGGITSTPVNPSAVATVAGRLDFGPLASTVLVNAYNFNAFTDFAPTTAGLVLQGVIGSGGGINKTGTGVLQLNGQDVFTGQLNVQAGTVQLGTGNAGSRFSRLNLSTATSRLNLNNQSTTLGSLAGSGIITNTAVSTPNLTVGFDNTDSTFSGQISRFNDATPNALNLVKIGSGTLTMTSVQNADGSSGGVTVSGGGLTYSGAGAAYPSTVLTPVTFNVNTSGTLTLDNTGINTANRLGLNASQGTLNLSGGTLAMVANSTGSSETVNVLGFGSGASTIRFTPGVTGATAITVTGSVGGQGGQDSGLITGVGLGLASGPGSVNVVVTGAFPFPGTQGGGAATSEIISIRPDLLGDAAGGPGTGFITRDIGTNFLRPLNQGSELSSDMINAATAGAFSNTGLNSTNNATTNRIIANQTINSLTLLGTATGTVTLNSGLGASAGVFAATGLPLTLTAGSGGFLALTNATIGLGAVTTGGVTFDIHVVGTGTTLTLNSSILAATANGIVKADAGTLILGARQYYASGTTVNGGTLVLNGGGNTIVAQPTGTIPVVSILSMNGGRLDLNGTSQMFGSIQSNNAIPGTGGVIINSLVSPVTLTSATATGTTFAGSIGTGVLSPAGNAINFVKSGNSTLVLTNVNSYNGSTVLRGGQITLQDSGTLGQTTGITVNFGTLLLNEAGLNPLGANPVRMPATAPITLNGGTFQQNSGGSLDATGSFNTITLGSGTNTIAQGTVQNAGSSALMNIGSLVQQNNVGSGPATVNFLSTNGTLGGGGLSNNQIQIGTVTSSGGAALPTASAQVNGILPAWITINGSDFAGYLPSPVGSSLGIGAIGSANYPAYSVTPPAIATSANNLSVTTVTQAVAGRTVNSLAIRGPAANVDAVAPIVRLSDTLTISSGGLLLNSGTNGGASANVQGGRITAGSVANAPGSLYVTASGTNPNIINSQIVDNGNQIFSGNVDGLSNVVTVGSTSGLVVGQPVSGVGIAGGATITAITSPTTFTMSANATAATFLVDDLTLKRNNSATVASSTAVNVGNANNLAVGMYVTGPGIPAGTTVVALGTPAAPSTITLSLAPTVTISQQNYFLNGVGNSQQNFTLTPARAATLTPGMSVTGAGIQPGTTVASVIPATGAITLSLPTVGNVATQFISFGATLGFARFGTLVAIPANTNHPATGSIDTNVTVQNVTGLAVGMLVSGPGIPVGTKINSFTTLQPNTNPPTPPNTNPNSTTIFLRAPSGQNFDALEANSAVNLVFGSGVSVGNGTPGAVSLVKTGTGTLTLTPQPVMAGSTNINTTPVNTSNIVTVTSTAGLAIGMTVSGTGIPAGATITAINSTTGAFTISANATAATGNFAPAQLSFGPGTSGIDLATSAFSNAYTGGTFVNQGTLALAGFPGATVIPGDLTISNATVSTVTTSTTGTTTNNSNSIALGSASGLSVGMAVVGPGIPAGEFITGISGNTITITSGTNVAAGANTLTFGSAQQISAASNATINGSGILNLFAANTLASLRFNNTGGNANPLASGSEMLTLTAANAITSVNDNLSTTPTITGKSLVLSNALPTINVSGLSLDGLVITAPISTTAPLIKTGAGSLLLTPNFALANSVTPANGTTIALPSTFGLAVGMQVTGTGLPGPVSITNGATTAGSAIISFNANTSLAALTIGMQVVGTGIPAGSTIAVIDNTAAAPKVTLSNGSAVTAASASSTAPLRFGDNAFITSISPNSIIISPNVGTTAPVSPATSSTLTFTGSTSASGLNLNGGSLILTQSSSQITGVGTTTVGSATIAVTSTAGLAVGMAVSGVGIPIGEFITAVGANSITVSTGTGVTAQGSTFLTYSGTPASILSGPFGNGALNMADGTALLSDGSLRTISNSVNIAVNATFGPLPGGGTALAGNGVTLAGQVALANGVAHTITVPDLQNVTTIGGQLSGGNNLNLTKAGTGTLVLANASALGSPTANTYSGTTTINVAGGVLRLGTGAVAAVPAGMNLSVSTGAVYDINGNAGQVINSLSNPSPGTAGNGGLVTNSSTTTAATLFVGGISAIDTATVGSAVFDGMLTAATSGNLSVTKVGATTLTLNGSSNYTGNTTVNAGKLIVNGALGATNVTVNPGATIGGTGTVGVATATPGGIFPTPGGSVTLTGGIFDLRNSSIGLFNVNTTGAGNALIVNTGSSFNFDISNTATDRIDLGNASLLSNGTGVLVNFTQTQTTLANGIYNLITFGARSGAGTYALGTGAPGNFALSLSTGALILNVGGVPLNFYWKGGAVSSSWSATGTSNFTSDPGGVNNTASNLPNVTSIVNFNATGFNNLNLNTTLGANFTIDSLNFLANSTTPVTIGGANTLTLINNISILSGAAAATISTTGFVLGSPQTWSNASTSILTVSAPVTGNQPLTISSTSSGRVVLSGSNTGFTGGITVNGNGTVTALQLGSATALGPVGGPNPIVVNLGALDMNGFSATVSSLGSTSISGIIRNDLTGTTSTLNVIQSGTTTYSGVFKDAAVGTGKFALVVDGGGTLQLTTPVATNVANYSGGTTIGTVGGLGGTVKMGNGGSEIISSLGTGPVTINTGGTLNFSPGGVTTTFNIPNSFILSGGQIQSSGGNQHLLAVSATTGTTSTITPSPSTTVGQDLFIDGILAGNGSLAVGGGGTGKVILTNNGNTYTGQLTSTASGNLQLAGAIANSTVLALADLVVNSGANGLTFGSAVTSATVGSLSGGGNFNLQNTAGTNLAVALTVGGNNNASLTYTGVMSNSAVGINGSFIKTGSGTLILTGLNTYRGTTTVNGGTLLVNNNSLTGSVTGFGSVSVTGTATLAGNGVIQGTDNVTAGAITLGTGTFLDPGISTGAFGTLRFGVQTAAAVSTTLTLSANSTYRFDVGAGASSFDRVIVAGPANIISGAKLAITAGTTPDQGTYTLLSTTGGVAGTFGANVTGTPASYSVVYTGTTVDLQHFSTIGSVTTPSGLQVIKGASVPFTVTVANSAPADSTSLSFFATAGTNTTGTVASSISPIVVGAQSDNAPGASGLSFNSAGAGVLIGVGQSGNFTVSAANASTSTNASVVGNVSVDVLDHAATPVGISLGTLTVQPVRQGYTGPITSTNFLTVANAAGFRVNLKGSTAPSGNVSLNPVSGITPGSSGNITASLSTGLAAGAYTQAFNYLLGDDSTLNGSNNGALGTVNITVNGNVYTGQGVWGAAGSGAWGTFGSWQALGGYPGLDGPLSIDDTATFGSTLTGTASLNGVTPSLSKLTFNTTSGTIAQGTGTGFVSLLNNSAGIGPIISVTGGTAGTPVAPTISAPMVFSNTVTVTPATVNDSVTVSGAINGPGGVTKTGAGTLFLTGTNLYVGKTTVNGGTLSVASEASLGALPATGGVPVPDQISIDNGAKLLFAGNTTLDATQGITVGSGNGILDVAATKTAIINSTITGTLTGSGTATGTITKTGAGTLNIRGNIQSELPLNAPTFNLNAGTVSLAAGPLGAQPTSTLSTGGMNFNGGTLAINIQGNDPNHGTLTNNDFLVANNGTGASPSIRITAPTNLSIAISPGFMPTPDSDKFFFLRDDTRTGADNYASFFVVNGVNATPGTIVSVNGYYFKIDYHAGLNANEIALLSVVPEPGTAALLLGAAGILGGVVRRRRARNIPFGI